MSPDVIGYIIGGLFALAGTVYAARARAREQSRVRQAQSMVERQRGEIEDKRVDGEAYERAQRINEQTVGELRSEVSRLRSDLADERYKREELTRRVDTLSGLLRRNQITVPGDNA